MNIDQLLAQARSHSIQTHRQPNLTVTADWAQGRTVFGGLSAAMLYAAMQEQVASDRVLRSYSCNFVGPLNTQTPFTIEVEVLRQGSNVTQIAGRIIQHDKVCLIAQACFGVGRKSKIKVLNNDVHGMEVPKKAKFIPQIPKVTPKFLRHFELAVNKGSLPFAGSDIAEIHGWMRFKQAPEKITDAHLIAIVDAWPPTTLQMLRWPAPASTVSWNIEFIHPHLPVASTDWFAYQAITRQADEGYGHTEANIWDAQGELVAISRQTVAVFD